MCYRPSWATAPNDQVQQGTCPTCGIPVAAPIGITSGTCPHCGNPITAENALPKDAKPISKKIL